MIVFHNGSKSRNILPLQNKFSLTRTRSQSVRRQKKRVTQKPRDFEVILFLLYRSHRLYCRMRESFFR